MQQSAKDFRRWMSSKYPNDRLSVSQDKMIELIFDSLTFSSGKCTGKSFLIKLLAEYDKDRSNDAQKEI